MSRTPVHGAYTTGRGLTSDRARVRQWNDTDRLYRLRDEFDTRFEDRPPVMERLAETGSGIAAAPEHASRDVLDHVRSTDELVFDRGTPLGCCGRSTRSTSS